MERGVPKILGCRSITLAITIIAGWLFVPAYSQTPSVALLLEQTPVKGGEITPIAGVHHFASGSEVTLTAVPKPGYQFVHWLGDVSDPRASSTIVYLNKPKVIVAVFEQSKHDILPAKEGLSAAGGGGGGGLMPTATNLSRPGGISGGGGGKAKPQKIVYILQSGDTAPEVPEPATGVLLVMGSLFAFTRRGSKRAAR